MGSHSRRRWVGRFAAELEKLRPHLAGTSIARRVGEEAWLARGGLDAEEAAHSYHYEHSPDGKTKVARRGPHANPAV